MTEPTQRRIPRRILIGALGVLALGLLASAMVIAYSTYTKLTTTLQELQRAHAAEQAKTRTLTQKADELSKALEQARAGMGALEESQKASEQEKKASAEQRAKLEGKGAMLETALQELRTAHAVEQAKTRALAQKADELSKGLEQGQARVKALEESNEQLKGWLMKAEKELQMRDEAKRWGRGFRRGVNRIFF